MRICARGSSRAQMCGFLLLAVAAAAGYPLPALSETLNEALASAYKVNPRLDAARPTPPKR